MKKIILSLSLLLLLQISPFAVFSQLVVTPGATAQQMVQNVLVGGGVTVSNFVYTGTAAASGTFTTGTNATGLGFPAGILLTTGLATDAAGVGSYFASTDNFGGGDPQLQTLVTSTINDASVLQFDFIPESDTIKFRYVFGSEEYPEWVGSTFNDVFGFFISGANPAGGVYTNKNIAIIPGTTSTAVSINNVNNGTTNTGPCANCAYYVNNSNGTYISYDGLTTILTAWAKVVPCTSYHMKLAVGDAGDYSYDSGVFLEANSLTSPHITTHVNYTLAALDTVAIEGCSDANVVFHLPFVAPADWIVNYTVGGTAIPGTDYTPLPASAIIPAGSDSVMLTIHPLVDGIPEPTETVILIVQTSICQSTYDTVVVHIIDNMPLSLTTYGDTTLCGGYATIGATVTGGIQPYSYLWNLGDTIPNIIVSPSVTTTYNVMVTDVCHTSDSGVVVITVAGTFAGAGTDVTICIGDATTLTASGGTQYLWSTGEPTQSISVNPTSNTTYFVTVTQLCSDVDSVNVYVNPLPTLTATSNPDSICAGWTSTLSLSGGTVISWSSSPVDPSLAPQINSQNPVVSPTYTTTYTVIGKDTNQCVNTTTTSVVVYPQPTASFVTTPNPVSISNTNVFITNTSTGNSPLLIWDLGDGTTSGLQQFYHEFPNTDSGSYLVTLIVTNNFGCADTTSRTVYVKPDYSIYIPNAFSPNGDGVNDMFYVYFTNIHEYHLQIFDRWGEQMFNTFDLTEGWDGTFKGTPLPSGLYVYRISYSDSENIKHQKHGTVTIMK
ncbi:MAG: choice-of-anchor L domain-containing protein [Bacteroidota bacterium]